LDGLELEPDNVLTLDWRLWVSLIAFSNWNCWSSTTLCRFSVVLCRFSMVLC